jgi:hypothetical protein
MTGPNKPGTDFPMSGADMISHKAGKRVFRHQGKGKFPPLFPTGHLQESIIHIINEYSYFGE